MLVSNYAIKGAAGRLLRASSVLVLLAGIIAVTAAPRSFAATTAPVPSATPNTLRVTPVRRDIEALPGTSVTVEATVSNLTNAAVTVHPIENDFIASDESGTPALILDENTFAPTHSLKRFMAPLPNVTIPAGQAKTINVVVNVPKNAQAGGYFGAVRFAPTSPDGGDQVNLSVSVASLILLTVPGKTVETLNLTNFDIQQKGQTGSNFSDPHNIKASVRFENKGNVQLAPFGKLSIKQGNTILYETDFNITEPHDVVLPDSARKWTIPLDKIGAFGHYTVSATFTYGSTNQTIDVVKSFWVIPTSLIIGAIAGVAGLIILASAIWLALRAYKRRIVKQYESRQPQAPGPQEPTEPKVDA